MKCKAKCNSLIISTPYNFAVIGLSKDKVYEVKRVEGKGERNFKVFVEDNVTVFLSVSLFEKAFQEENEGI